MNLYAITGIAIKQGKTMSAKTVTALAESDVEALGMAHVFARQQYPAAEGYGQHEAIIFCIYPCVTFKSGHVVTVTIEEPAHE